MEKKRIDCPALPPGWKKEEVIRKSGLSAGKSDVYYFSPTGKKFRSKPQLSRYLGNTVDLSSFDFRTGKMMPSKLQKNKQRLRNDPLNQNKGKPDLNTTLPIRQTASIFKQPVTKVTNHPSNKVKSDPQRVNEQPRQRENLRKKARELKRKQPNPLAEALVEVQAAGGHRVAPQQGGVEEEEEEGWAAAGTSTGSIATSSAIPAPTTTASTAALEVAAAMTSATAAPTTISSKAAAAAAAAAIIISAPPATPHVQALHHSPSISPISTSESTPRQTTPTHLHPLCPLLLEQHPHVVELSDPPHHPIHRHHPSSGPAQGTAPPWEGPVDDTAALIKEIEMMREAIDGRFMSLEGQMVATQGHVAALDGFVTSVERHLASIDGHMSALNKRVFCMEGPVSAIEARVACMEGHMSSIEARMASVERHLSTMEGHMGALDGRMGAIEGALYHIHHTVGQMAADLANCVSALQCGGPRDGGPPS
uniref:Methyl-CpG-binding domain protein 2 isoform X1 n=1 Tax=Geotrypetes seraphini TaxID=260995 RepID=A0A6P8PP72_GEOSA|nr:methyl-CpG-binding domain protein 2 isoform X1 [Geotrypetes seraphini]